MSIYKALFNKGYLKGVNNDSPIALKGAKKLITIFNKTYDFINIDIINESDYYKEFYAFETIFEKFFKKHFSKINTANKIYDSSQEDNLFIELKNFNLKYKKIKESEKNLSEKSQKDINASLYLYEFNNKREQIITDLVCKKILRNPKKYILNFYVWINERDGHYSLVSNIDDYYIFMDSCSIYFKRWPNKEIISKNDDDKLFNKFKTFVMISFLQYDEFNCVSFTLAFIQIIIDLYQKLNKDGLINYLYRYFNYLWLDKFLCETSSVYDDLYEPIIYLLPKEILELSQSISKLKYLKTIVLNLNNEEEAQMIQKIINEAEKESRIGIYRRFHLDCLMESID